MHIHKLVRGPVVAVSALLLLSSACGSGGGSGGPGASGRTVTVASSYTLPGTPIQIADSQGYFAEQGIRIKYVRIKATSDAIPMLTRGDVDAATGSAAAGLFNAIAGDSDLRFVADAGTSVPGHPIWYLVVRSELVDSGKVKDFADLRGLKVALPGPGTGFDRGLAAALDKGGLSKSDVRVVSPLAFPDAVTGLGSGSVDAAFLIEPLASIGKRQHTFVPLWAANDIVGPSEEGVLMYSPRFSQQRKDVAQRFMVGYLKGVRDYLGTFTADPSLPDAKVKAITAHVAKVTGVPEPTLAHVAAPGIDPNGAVNQADLDELQEFFVRQGAVPKKVDLAEIIDSSFVEQALKVVGSR